MLINIIFNWEESGITWETGLWTCLWGITLIALTELGGHALCGWRHSPIGTLDCVSGERTEQQPACLCVPCFLCSLLLYYGYSVTSYSKSPLPWLPCRDALQLELWATRNSDSLKLLWSENLIKARGEEAKTLGEAFSSSVLFPHIEIRDVALSSARSRNPPYLSSSIPHVHNELWEIYAIFLPCLCAIHSQRVALKYWVINEQVLVYTVLFRNEDITFCTLKEQNDWEVVIIMVL